MQFNTYFKHTANAVLIQKKRMTHFPVFFGLKSGLRRDTSESNYGQQKC